MINLKLIVGLGNPTTQYENTRHNVGFWFIDKFNKKHYAYPPDDKIEKGILNDLVICEYYVKLLKPITYMNGSGLAIKEAVDLYNIKPNEILVVHDEIHLEPGRVALKFSGGAGGNNGLKNIIDNIGNDFWRLRIGVGKPDDPSELLNYVLSEPSSDDVNKINSIQADVIRDITSLIYDTDGFQRKYHRK